jgi:methionyl-tRNA formyltransferase
MIVSGLDALAAGRLDAAPQPEAGATYAKKLTRADEAIDWTRPAADVARQVRALAPRPGAHFTLGGETWKVLAATAERDGAPAPGTVLDDQLTVACGAGALRLATVQRPGRKAMAAAEALRGHPVPPGTVLG